MSQHLLRSYRVSDFEMHYLIFIFTTTSKVAKHYLHTLLQIETHEDSIEIPEILSPILKKTFDFGLN